MDESVKLRVLIDSILTNVLVKIMIDKGIVSKKEIDQLFEEALQKNSEPLAKMLGLEEKTLETYKTAYYNIQD